MDNAVKRSRRAENTREILNRTPGIEKSFTAIHKKKPEGEKEYPIWAKFPRLDTQEKADTFSAFNVYMEKYNHKVKLVNREIKKQNKVAHLYFKDTKNKAKIKTEIASFSINYKNISVWERNKKAREYNQLKGVEIIPLDLVKPLKQNLVKTFEAIIWEYSHQLHQFTTRKKKISHLALNCELQKVDINAKHLLNTKGKHGLYLLHAHINTIKNHKQKLIEAGVLINSEYRGSSRGTLHHINPQILSIFDDAIQKTLIAENHLLRNISAQNLCDTVLLTCSIIQSNLNDVDNSTSTIAKKSAKGSNSSSNASDGFLLDSYPTDNFTCSPSGSNRKNETRAAQNLTADKPKNNEVGPSAAYSGTTPAEKRTDQTTLKTGIPADNPIINDTRDIKIAADLPKNGVTSENFRSDKPKNKDGISTKAQKNTQFLRQKTRLAWDLAVLIGNKKHYNQELTPIQQLHLEVNSGTLDNKEFNELLLQDLMLLFAKIYANNADYYPYHKVWKQVYDSWLTSYFFIHRNGHFLDKKTVLERYKKLVFTLTNKRHGVLNRIARGKFTPPSAPVFLNPYSATPGTLFHHYKKVEKHSPKVDAEIKNLGEKFKEEADKSKTYNIYKRRLFKKFSQHVNGKIDDNQLFRYTKENMPPELQRDFNLHWTVFINNKNHVKTP